VSALSVSRSSYAGGTAVPATLPAWEYDSGEYGTVYFKTALGLWTLENIVGTERFHQAMREYLTTYRFKHPTGADFRASLEGSLDTDLSWLFDEYLPGTGVIDYAVGPIRNDSTGSTVTVERVGEVPAPVDVRVTLASGAQQTRQWDGSDSSEVYTFSASDPAVKVEVDPGQKLAAELNVVNNTATSQASLVPALTFAERLIFWLQSIVQSVGLFG
jgi:aminopeptidase N